MSAARTPPSLLISLIPVAALVGLLVLNVQVFGSADNQIALVVATAVAAAIACWGLKQPWKELEAGIRQTIDVSMTAILILLAVGMLIGAWVHSGTVPLLIVYGLDLISPAALLVTACLVCCVVSLACGSSWTTAGTVGVALVGVGQTLGIDPGMTAGAVVSGAYFGDKMSPLSDTTNLAPAMSGATLMEHVRHMVWTVTPALLGALAVYWFVGQGHAAGPEVLARTDAVKAVLAERFVLSPWLLLSPVLVLGLVMTSFPAIPALVLGSFVAVLLGVLIQPTPEGGWIASLQGHFAALYGGYSLSPFPAGSEGLRLAAEENLVALLDGRGGMKSMLGTIALIFCALSFGGVMERSGMLGAIASAILKLAKGTGSLIASTVFMCLGINILASDQYMAIVIPGRMFRQAFLDRRLHPKNLSRALEDSGTVTSALVPWNTCGAQMTAVLGVATLSYAPWAVLNWLCPLISILYGYLGFKITKITDAEARQFEGQTSAAAS
jgi:NhaC family Na+:H+ antiporter